MGSLTSKGPGIAGDCLGFYYKGSFKGSVRIWDLRSTWRSIGSDKVG